MSHLPLDARAILEYLNELGYRNITAPQLKEFMKGMQPHSEAPSTTTKASASATARNSVTSNPKTTANNNNNINAKSPKLCKLVKGKRPLVNFNFYLDIKDHQISKKVEERITELGGTLEFFLTKSVTHFITDRSLPGPPTTAARHNPNNNNQNGYCVKSPTVAVTVAGGLGAGAGAGVSGGGVGGGGSGVGVGIISYPITPSPYIQSPQTPATPQTPYTNHTHSGDSATDGIASNHSKLGGNPGVVTTPNHKKKTSRADAMLHRALQSQPHTQTTTSTFTKAIPSELEKRPQLEPGAYAIWNLDYAIRFLKKVTSDLKQYAKKSQTTKGTCEPILLKGHFIKIETIKRHSRPYYSVFRKIEWPKVHFKEDGAFRLTPKEDELKSAKEKPSKSNAMTRKSRSSSKHNHNHMRLKAKQAPKQTDKPVAADNTSEKQCGVCEICKIEYDTLTIHLKTKDHEFFARNQSNYLALDSLIKSSANVDQFLHENTKSEPTKHEVKTEPMEVVDQEEVTRQTRQSSRIQTPPPPLKIKTKLKEVENQTTAKKPVHNNVKKSTKPTLALDSPPIRHPLPASTIYKVVENTKSRAEPTTPQTSSIIVKFRKIRQTELSILNGEAENFMFPKRPASSECATDSDRQTSTDSNRISSSSISSESHSIDDHNPGTTERPDSAAKRRRVVTASSRKTMNSGLLTATAPKSITKTVTSVCYQSFPNTPIQPEQTSRITRELRETNGNSNTISISNSRNSVTPKPSTQRRRRCVKGGRKPNGSSRSRRQQQRELRQRCASEDRMGDQGTEEDDDDEDYKAEVEDDKDDDNSEEEKKHKTKHSKKDPIKIKLGPPAFDINKGRLKEQKYAFERLPMNELWFGVFTRQDTCQERMFEYWGSTSYRKLPYEIGPMPIRTLPYCKVCTPSLNRVKKEQNEGVPAAPQKQKGKSKKNKKEKGTTDSNSKSNTPDPDKSTKNTPRIRNKLLKKATFLSYELMPRKSPREHASTLAILSCLIKQRQDSEPDEPAPPIKEEKTPEKVITPKRKTPSPAPLPPPPPSSAAPPLLPPPPSSSSATPLPARIDTPEPLQFVSEISENVKRLRRGQRKFEDFVPSKSSMCPVKIKKPRKPKAKLEFELDEKRLKSLEAKQKSSVQLEHEIDAYLDRMTMKTLRLTPTPPPSESSGFVDDFLSDVNLIDLIDCYDGGGTTGPGGGPDDEENSVDQPVHRPASTISIFNLFSAHNRRRKNNKINKTGWPKKRRAAAASTRQNHLLQKRERFRFFCDYQTRQKNRLIDTNSIVATSMTPPDTDLDEKDYRTRSPVPGVVAPITPVPGADGAILCKEEILNNGYMSPSEKADNSDIFTVSSDGLDTDLDLSSSQIKAEDMDDECTTSSTIAAPPATPEPIIKSTASPRTTMSTRKKISSTITNIIQKEVKVSCKRLRTPFRRFHLRKLIKYEESIGINIHQKDYFDNLYRKTTASFRAKSDVSAEGERGGGGVTTGGVTSRKDPVKPTSSTGNRTKLDRANLENVSRRMEKVKEKAKDDTKPGRSGRGGAILSENNAQSQQKTGITRATTTRKSQPESDQKTETSTARPNRATEKPSNGMWIRPRSKTPNASSSSSRHRKKDPVQLYQYYRSEWERFKTNLPGENSRSELRWQIRHKLLGE